jgi:hypothetical protein
LKNYISVYDNVLDKSFCDSLIEKFETRNESQVRRDDVFKTFTEINFAQAPEFANEQNFMIQRIESTIYQYTTEHGIKFFPEQIGFEQVRMKRYNPNVKEEFREHVDVGDYASARRFLVMFIYLNDVDEGGETTFIGIDEDIKVKPKAGRMLVFPPMWTHPHAGLTPISGPKYICGSYLHYV